MWWRLLLFSLAIGGYVGYRALLPRRIGWGWKLLLAALIALTAFRLPILSLIGGDIPFAPELPPTVNHIYTWLFITLLLFFCYLFAWQLACASFFKLFAAWRRLSADAQQSLALRAQLIVLPIFMIVSAFCIHGGMKQPRIREVSLPFPSQQPMRVALLSDLHVSVLKDEDFLSKIVERTNALKPDLIVITGDFVDGSVPTCASRMAALRHLHAPLGVYGVAGNHDYYSGYEEWRAFLRKHGVHMLDNTHVQLPGTDVVLAGITERTAQDLPGMAPPNAELALSGIEATAPIILLAHRPYDAPSAGALGVDVMLSGHTHGGLALGADLLVAAMNEGYIRGIYHEGDMHIYVSPGTSCGSRTPLRFGVPSEITLITLEPSH